MASRARPAQPAPRRGEIWTAYLDGAGKQRHWVLVVSLDARNLSDRALSILIIPFASRIIEIPTTLVLQPGETGLPGPPCLRGHYITALAKAHLIERTNRALSIRRMREVCSIIRRSYDPEAAF